jgi:hypothetical protein
MIIKAIIGIVVGGIVGGIMGYVGKCSHGACPLMGHPFTGAIFGAILGLIIALSVETK